MFLHATCAISAPFARVRQRNCLPLSPLRVNLETHVLTTEPPRTQPGQLMGVQRSENSEFFDDVRTWKGFVTSALAFVSRCQEPHNSGHKQCGDQPSHTAVAQPALGSQAINPSDKHHHHHHDWARPHPHHTPRTYTPLPPPWWW